jgi:predicted nuclease with RNAse H fold
MLFCGVDVAAKRGSNLCVLEESGDGSLKPTFYERGTVRQVDAAVKALGNDVVVALDAPQRPRMPELLAEASLRERLDLPRDKYKTGRVCEAQLRRKNLPSYPTPAPKEDTKPWMQCGFELFGLLGEWLPLYQPPDDGNDYEARVPQNACRQFQLVETYPDAAFCTLLLCRPLKKKDPPGMVQRIDALEKNGVVKADACLWDRTMDEIEACVAALTAYRFARGAASWIGHPKEGVMVLPVKELERKYQPEGSELERRELPKVEGV